MEAAAAAADHPGDNEDKERKEDVVKGYTRKMESNIFRKKDTFLTSHTWGMVTSSLF